MRYYSEMNRSHFIGTILVIILGVNLGAWTLSVATSSGRSFTSLSVPVGAPAIDAQSQAASVRIAIIPATPAEVATTTSTTSASAATVLSH